MKIIREYVAPPIPTTMFDWVAYADGDEESGPHGRGATEQEALLDLAEQLRDLIQ